MWPSRQEFRWWPGGNWSGEGTSCSVIHGWTATFGGAQMILVDPETGTLTVGSDPRREAYGIAY